jgi:hypothetical protein
MRKVDLVPGQCRSKSGGATSPQTLKQKPAAKILHAAVHVSRMEQWRVEAEIRVRAVSCKQQEKNRRPGTTRRRHFPRAPRSMSASLPKAPGLRRCRERTRRANSSHFLRAPGGSRKRCINTRSSQRPNLCPTSRKYATRSKPRCSWKRIDASFAASIPPIMTCFPSASARGNRASTSKLPTP